MKGRLKGDEDHDGGEDGKLLKIKECSEITRTNQDQVMRKDGRQEEGEAN